MGNRAIDEIHTPNFIVRFKEVISNRFDSKKLLMPVWLSVKIVGYSLLEYDDLRNENLPYVGMLLVSSERLRTLISSMFGDVVDNTHNYNKKRLYCLWYLELLRY